MEGRIIRTYVLASLVLLATGVAESVAVAESPRELLDKKLAEFTGADRGQVIPLASDSVVRAFPGDSFYALRFRQYPVAMLPPPPLRTNNIFVVEPAGSVEHLADIETLKRFFQTMLAPVSAETEAKEAAKAWLTLAQEFRQDGFLRFTIPDDAVRIASATSGGLLATGRAVVNQHGGNSGEITAALTFNPGGALANVSEAVNIKRGIRPICQATKLLDRDPIVRGMAEQDLLVMGKDAKEYLDTVRATASAELQQAIDMIWERIRAEGR